MNYTVDDYRYMADLRTTAFIRIAHALGKAHPVTKMMGNRAHGKSEFECGPGGGLRSAITEMAASEGAFDILNKWARDNDEPAQRIMLQLWPSGYQRCNEAHR